MQTLVFLLISTTIVRRAENLVKVTTSVSQTKPLAVFVKISAEQHAKIKNRCRYTRKLKSDANTSKDNLDLLGDDEESFSGSQADLEGAAENLFSSPPPPNHYALKHCQLKLHVMSHQPQVLHCKIKLKIG